MNRLLDLVGRGTRGPGIKGVAPVSSGNVVTVEISTSKRYVDRGIQLYGIRERGIDCQSDGEAREEGGSSVT